MAKIVTRIFPWSEGIGMELWKTVGVGMTLNTVFIIVFSRL